MAADPRHGWLGHEQGRYPEAVRRRRRHDVHGAFAGRLDRRSPDRAFSGCRHRLHRPFGRQFPARHRGNRLCAHGGHGVRPVLLRACRDDPGRRHVQIQHQRALGPAVRERRQPPAGRLHALLYGYQSWGLCRTLWRRHPGGAGGLVLGIFCCRPWHAGRSWPVPVVQPRPVCALHQTGFAKAKCRNRAFPLARSRRAPDPDHGCLYRYLHDRPADLWRCDESVCARPRGQDRHGLRHTHDMVSVAQSRDHCAWRAAGFELLAAA